MSTFIAALLFALWSDARAQQTLRVTFDGPPVMPPGTSLPHSQYIESRVAASGAFSRRWPAGDTLFPDNAIAYVQSRAGFGMFFYLEGRPRTFDAVSVDLALYSAASLAPVAVQFKAEGYSPLDIIATTTFNVPGVLDSEGRPSFQTFSFPPEFRGMYYLSITPSEQLWSLDNLVIYVPEPSVPSLLAVGGGLLALCRRRHRHEA